MRGNSPTQDASSEQSAEQRRRRRKERAAKSRTPEPKNIVSGAGQPLDPGVRRELEEQLGHDLGRVRLHTGRDAGQLTELVGADAVAVGQDVFFREGAFKPGTDEGRRLLAHELLHTVQNPHGLGALRAGRDMGAVSLPQQAIEREAESAALEVVRPNAAGPEGPEPDVQVEEGQATPGWLRYATVDADRRRMEALDPATLVDRLANGLVRSLRGDPEDRSGRVRIQLARLAPEVQDSVLDRLEVRLPAPVVDRLLDLVEEQEQGPLPLDAASAPAAVPGEAEEIAQERERDAAESDDRRDEAGRLGGTGDGRDPQSGKPGEGGGRTGEPHAPGGRDGADADGKGTAPQDQDQKHEEGAGQGEAAERQQDRSRSQKDEKDTSAEEDEKDAQGETKDAAGAEEKEKEEQREERKAEGSEEEAAQEAQRQAAEEESQQSEDLAEGPAAGRAAADAPAAVDRSGAEPGEKARTGDDLGTGRSLGDPENEEGADDEPLGLVGESSDLDAEDDRDDGEDQASGASGASGGEDTTAEFESDTSTPAALSPVKPNPRPTDDEDPAGGPMAPEQAPTPAADRSDDKREGHRQDEDRQLQDLQADPTAERDGDSGQPPGSTLSGGSAPDGRAAPDITGRHEAERDKEQADEHREDAEARRRDEAVRTADDGAGAPGPAAGGETAPPERLAKAGEDGRGQAGSTASGSSQSSTGAGSAGSAGPRGGQSTGAGDTDRARAEQTGGRSGTEQESASGKDTTGKDTTGKDTQDPDAAEAPETSGVSEGNGPVTEAGPTTGPDKVSAPGPSSAPKLAPGNGPYPMSAGTEPKDNAPKAAGPSNSTASKAAAGAAPQNKPTGAKRQAARQVAKKARSGGGGGGGGSSRSSSAPAPVRGGARGGGRAGASRPAKSKKEAPAPDVSNATPESGLATAGSLKPHQALETLKGVDGAVGRSVEKERGALRKAPPKTQRPSGSPRTVPGGPKAAASGTYTNAKVARTEAARGKTPEISGEQKPEGEAPGANAPEPSWWDIAVTIGAQLFGKLLKEILPLDDVIDSILQLPTEDEGLKKARVGDAPRLPLENDSDPQRTDEQGQKLDERKTELHRAGRDDAARPMGEDQIYPDVPDETLTGKVAGGGRKGAGAGGARKPSSGVPIESASAVAEHDRGPQIKAGFADGRQKMTQERRTKDKKAQDDKRGHDQDLQREVSSNSERQAATREQGRTKIDDSRDKWRKEQDDKVGEIDDKKGKKYDKVRKDIKDKDEETDKDVDKRTEDDNKKIEDEDTKAEREAEKKQEEGKGDADNWLEEAIDKLKEFFEELKNAIKSVFEKARKAVTELIDKFKQQVFKLIDAARNWVVEQINDFADALIALGDELLADYPAMRDKWRDTINGARDWAVKKVNDYADALKEVAGKLLDGLCGALLAGLDVLETGLLAAVDVAKTVTVGALEFGAAVVEGLGEWAAIFNDVVSDPGDWISKAGAAADTGAREYLFDEIKTAVKAWFDQKVQEIIGVPLEDFQELLDGGVTVAEMGQMAWDAALPQLPVIIGVMVVEKVVAKLIPGVGWVMAVIDALQTAWGALSEILAAFGLFMDFLKSVKSGNGALPFAKAVAAGVVALLELVYTFLIEGVSRFMGKVTDKLGDILKNIRGKKNKPGRSDDPDQPGAPSKPKDQAPTPDEARTPAPNRPADRASDRPTDNRPAPRKPSSDRTSRPPSKPAPGKRSSPGKKPRPAHTTRPKKRRDDEERREEGREVNAARRRERDAARRRRDEDRDDRAGGPARRGPAKDTLRPDRRRRDTDRTDDDRDRDTRSARPDGRHRTDDRRPDRDHRDDRRHDTDKDTGKDRDRDRDDNDRGRDRDRPGRIRRARQTVKSAVNRVRRAGRRLYGKGRRLGRRLNDRVRRMRDQWRRRHDRLRDRRTKRHDRERVRKQNDPMTTLERPKARFRDEGGELHTLRFHGRGRGADLFVHSIPTEVPNFLADWRRDVARQSNASQKAEQSKAIKKMTLWHKKAAEIDDRIPARVPKSERSRWNPDRAELRAAMAEVAEAASMRRFNEIPDPQYPDYADRRATGHLSEFLGERSKTVFGGPGEDARLAKDGQPPGWDYIEKNGLGREGAWVRMHLLPERLGGRAVGNNLVPARGIRTNIKFLNEIENFAYNAIQSDAESKADRIIWYETDVRFDHTSDPEFTDFPSYIRSAYGRYEPIRGTGREPGDWKRIESAVKEFPQKVEPPGSDESGKLHINEDGHKIIGNMLKCKRSLADHLLAVRTENGGEFENADEVAALMRERREDKGGGYFMGNLESMLENLFALDAQGKVKWKDEEPS
ncbi:DUF4157 domain-containing protein [Streptomyces sp. NPDC048484]|uniref:eCIS core domain-containing protein n=1 Tax=Streptomyces sp. NPDC048484 TaxID=3155146 RepID=UPI0034295EF6